MKSACFTGHRDLTGDISQLEEQLYNVLERAVKNAEITEFYSGAAIGFDEICSKTILKLRAKYPQIRLHLILPCPPQEQSAKWNKAQRSEYMKILAAADTVEQTSQYYYSGCMKKRNARLVELSDCCFCFLNTSKSHSGTAQTVRMALNKKIMVINFFKAIPHKDCRADAQLDFSRILKVHQYPSHVIK